MALETHSDGIQMALDSDATTGHTERNILLQSDTFRLEKYRSNISKGEANDLRRHATENYVVLR